VQQQLLNRLTGGVLFEADIESDAGTSGAVRLGLAVKAAFKARASLRGADMRGADLRGADLRGADLSGASLRGTDLRGADLRGTDLRGADLSVASLRGTDMRGTDLRGTDLRGTDLRGADLRGMSLRGAYLDGADLRGAVWGDGAKRGEGVPITRAPIMVAAGPYDVWIWDRHVEIGCQIHEIEAWAAFSRDDIKRMDGERGVRFWREWRGPLLAVAKAAGRPLPAPAEREAA
jgi:hypothetical protein